MSDWRAIEAALVKFFKDRGIRPTVAEGEAFLGVYPTMLKVDRLERGTVTVNAVPRADAKPGLVSISELARYLERETS